MEWTVLSLHLWAWIVMTGVLIGGGVLLPRLLKKRQQNREKFTRKQRNLISGETPPQAHRIIPMVSFSEVENEHKQRLHAWQLVKKETKN